MTNLELTPIRLADAAAFVALHHRHHGEPRGHKFSIGLASAGELVGVIIVGRPVARHYDDGATLEVTRRRLPKGTDSVPRYLWEAS